MHEYPIYISDNPCIVIHVLPGEVDFNDWSKATLEINSSVHDEADNCKTYVSKFWGQWSSAVHRAKSHQKVARCRDGESVSKVCLEGSECWLVCYTGVNVNLWGLYVSSNV